jgi:uncharacterized protein (TIGR02270 family)
MVNVVAASDTNHRVACAFSARLYEEHVDEAALLYIQRMTLLADPRAIGWKRLASLEARLEAHVDALVVGGGEAVEAWSARHAAEGGIGELYVGARLLARRQEWNALRAIEVGPSSHGAETARALADALTEELPDDTDPPFRVLRSSEGVWMCTLLEIVARRRSDRRDIAMDALCSSDTIVVAAAARAAGELRDRRGTALLYRALDHDDVSVRSEAALALAKLGDAHIGARCIDAARTEDWPRLCLGLAGGPTAAAVLLRAIDGGHATEAALLSLGSLGDGRAIEPLVSYLGDYPLAATTALALDLITGAGLTEEIVIEEDLDEDELFPHERECLTPAPASAAGPAPGRETVTRLSTSPDQWRAWWNVNGRRFKPAARYRAGKLVTPDVLLEGLKSEETPRVIRELTGNELAIRYACDVAFSPALTVQQQERAIHAYAAWASTRARGFEAGRGYYAGHLWSS